MSLRQKVRLEYDLDGQPHEVLTEYSAIDLRAWEGEFNRSALSTPLSISMLTWLAHHAAVRQGQLNGEMKAYRAFDEACTHVEGVPDDERPTRARAKATRKAAGETSSAG